MSKDLAKELLGAGVLRIAEESIGRAFFDDLPVGHEDDTIGHLAGKPHLVGDANHGHAVVCEADHRVEHFLDHFRIESRGRFIKQHDLGLHAESTRDRNTLLLTARELSRILLGLLTNAHPLEIFSRGRLRIGLADTARANGREHAVLQDRHMRKKVEALKDHADILTHDIDGLDAVVQPMTVHHDTALLDRLQAVDTAYQRRLARTGRTAEHDLFTSAHSEINVAESLVPAVPFLHALHFDQDLVQHGFGLRYRTAANAPSASAACSDY